MLLKDKINLVGQFSIKSIYADGSFDEYNEKNLIMESARTNMAKLIGGVSGKSNPINRFVIGTLGHVGTNILDNISVGEKGADNTVFETTRSSLFSEDAINGGTNYRIDFDTSNVSLDYTDSVAVGKMYNKAVEGIVDTDKNSVRRVVNGRTVTYTIIIPATNANNADKSAIGFTEAALYAGDDIFSMKTFPARVKEETVRFEITWSIIF